mgnify:CR=1 FL=1
MDLKEIFKCDECKSMIKEPVTLSCGNSICKRHLVELSKHKDNLNETIGKIFCRECNRDVQFLWSEIGVNKKMEELINRKILNLKFDKNFQETVREYENFQKNFLKYEKITNKREAYIYEYYQDMKNGIDLLREQYKCCN